MCREVSQSANRIGEVGMSLRDEHWHRGSRCGYPYRCPHCGMLIMNVMEQMDHKCARTIWVSKSDTRAFLDYVV